MLPAVPYPEYVPADHRHFLLPQRYCFVPPVLSKVSGDADAYYNDTLSDKFSVSVPDNILPPSAASEMKTPDLPPDFHCTAGLTYISIEYAFENVKEILVFFS